MADIIVAAILILLIGAAVYKVITDKKKGIGSCGHSCESCSHGCSTANVPERFRLKK
ncbi:FeoB-associated Cys-rich membrane protein [[Clostridium] aminophilum]|uniref:FeoB-associated Cys-rich membrane protein n=1 Tax=[Clostridium] aminophilum TaxID=1526 RepID=UPI0026F0ADA2|nr:FeoB-associated Cys-rich membrane protein [[Clostridium] aminophilum]MDD6197045.1 FeoB-associated Cys-rich membrane protein [[Clostridium] aminophilum]